MDARMVVRVIYGFFFLGGSVGEEGRGGKAGR